jgi:hypothetical protein
MRSNRWPSPCSRPGGDHRSARGRPGPSWPPSRPGPSQPRSDRPGRTRQRRRASPGGAVPDRPRPDATPPGADPGARKPRSRGPAAVELVGPKSSTARSVPQSHPKCGTSPVPATRCLPHSLTRSPAVRPHCRQRMLSSRRRRARCSSHDGSGSASAAPCTTRPTRVGRLLYNVLAMAAEADLIRLRTNEGMRVEGQGPAPGQATRC